MVDTGFPLENIGLGHTTYTSQPGKLVFTAVVVVVLVLNQAVGVPAYNNGERSCVLCVSYNSYILEISYYTLSGTCGPLPPPPSPSLANIITVHPSYKWFQADIISGRDNTRDQVTDDSLYSS